MSADGARRDVQADDLPRMTLIEHLEELRRRLLRSVLGLVVAFGLCFTFAEPIFRFLSIPVYRFLPPGTKLAYLGVTDPFMLYMKVALLAATFVASPFLLWQAWGFIAPGLYQRERRHALPFVVFGTLFFVAGGAFAYYIAFPFAVQFLLQVGAEFQAVLTVERYFGFLITVIVGLGLMFELPIIIVLLAKFGLVTPAFLLRNFRWAVLIIVFVSALVTPTADVFNLCLFAGPALALYLLGIGAAWVVTRDRRRQARMAEAAEAAE